MMIKYKKQLLYSLLFIAVFQLLSCGKGNPGRKTASITDVPGTYQADAPYDLKVYFGSLIQYGIARIYIHGSEEEGVALVGKSIAKLQQYATGKQLFYPIEEVNNALKLMAFEQGYLYSHGSNPNNSGQTFFFRYLEQAARLCPNLTFLTDIRTPDGEAGILYFPEWSQINPLYSFLLFRNIQGGFNVQLIGSIGEDKIEKIYPLKDESGNKYYLCSCNASAIYFRQFLYQIQNNRAHLLCSTEQDKSGQLNWPMPDADNYEIIFNPQKVCWNYCYQKGDSYHQIDGTQTLYLKLDGKHSHFYVK